MTGNFSDKETVERYLSGDSDAVAQVNTYIDGAFSVWRRRFGYESDDIRSDVHIKLILLLRKGQFEYRSSLKTFVSRIVSHTSIDYLRFSKRFASEDVGDLGLASGAESAERVVEKRQFGRLLFRVMRQLPKRCIQLWRMYLKQKMKYREIAEQLGKTEGNIRRQMWECREQAKALREKYEKNDKLS